MESTELTQHAQISSESVANIGQIVENAVKPLKGKYDGRGKYPRKKAANGTENRLGRKPAWAKHLTRNASAVVLKEIGIKQTCKQFLSATKWLSTGKNSPPIEVPDTFLRWEVFKYLWDRTEGKPFTAENPATSKQSAALAQDNRLQVAIQNLVLTPGAKRSASKGKKIKQLAAPQPTLDATTQPDGPQTAGDTQE